ncbi:MAG: hypothetical protein JWN15_1072 [Firmicutes bacterium]|nr:hypothetical protein [Bacillota bacterium]
MLCAANHVLSHSNKRCIPGMFLSVSVGHREVSMHAIVCASLLEFGCVRPSEACR